MTCSRGVRYLAATWILCHGLGVQGGTIKTPVSKRTLSLVTFLGIDCQSDLADCQDILEDHVDIHKESSVYDLHPDSNDAIFTFCDMDGGWTIIQQRLAGFTEFDQTWMNYKLGFGKPYEEDFWLGNENIWRLTNAAGIQKPYTLRVELTSAEGETRFAEYGYFRIEDEYNGYRLVIGNYSGNAGDAMLTQNGTKFSTGNYDHAMIMNSNCALDRSGGWWFTDCNHANLNGAYKPGSGHNGIFWDTWKEAIDSIKEVRMMIRRGD